MVWQNFVPIKNQAKEKFREEYDPSVPISKFLKRIEESVRIADDANFLWQPEQILQQTYDQMKKIGIYKYECMEWIKKDDFFKTWDN